MNGRCRPLVATVAAVLLAVLASGCAQGDQDDKGTGLQEDLDSALQALLAGRDSEGRWPPGQVPYVAEAAHAAGKDLRVWPEPSPVTDQLALPANGTPYQQTLRPLHAIALAHGGSDDWSRRVRDGVLAGFDGRQFGDPALLNDDAFALVVLGAADVPWSTTLEPAVDGLLANRSADGGWSWSPGGPGETDMTGIVLAGLEHAGAMQRVDREAVLGFLASTEVSGGGHALRPGGPANCDSTVWAIRSRAALGLPAPHHDWDFLLGLQRADGSFAFLPGGDGNALCTAEAATLLGLAQSGQVVLPSG